MSMLGTHWIRAHTKRLRKRFQSSICHWLNLSPCFRFHPSVKWD